MSHGVLVQLPAEFGLGHRGRFGFALAGVVQLAYHGAFSLAQLFQQGRANGQTVAACQLQDLAGIAEAGAHDHGRVVVLLVVVVDGGNGDHARIFAGSVITVVLGFVPVEDAAHERGDQEGAGFGTGAGLGEGEQQGQVALDTLFLQHLGGTDPFPGGSQFDQDAVVADAGFVVETDQFAGLGDAGVGIEGETGIHFGGDAARNDLQHFQTDVDCQLVARVDDLLCLVLALGFGPLDGVFDQRCVLGDLGGFQNQRGVGGGIDGLIAFDRFDIAGVGNNSGQGFQLG